MPPKTTDKSKLSVTGHSNRPVIYDKVTVKAFLGDKAMTVAQAKAILGWDEGKEGAPFDTSIPDGLTTLAGKKVRCTNNLHNRPYTDSWACQLAQDILNRNWADSRNGEGMTVNGETGVISLTGQVLSMQHRLIGLVKAGEIWAGPQHDHWVKKWPEEPTIECIMVYGVSEHPHVTRTLDNVRPRDLGDVFCTDTDLFGKANVNDRRTLTKMLGQAIRMLWSRTGAKNDPFNPHLSNSEACDFVEQHPKIKACIKHIFDEYSANWKANNSRMGAGFAAGFLYLMSACESDPAKYADKGRKEKALDMSNYEKACEFWALLCSNSPDMEPVRQALAALYGKDADRNPTPQERVEVILRAWNEFRLGKDGSMTLKNLSPRYGPADEDGLRKMLSPANVGGIDIGDKREPDADDVPDTEETLTEEQDDAEEVAQVEAAKAEIDAVKKASAKNVKADEGRKQIADLRAANPDLLLLFKTPTAVQCYEEDAEVVSTELALDVGNKDGLKFVRFPLSMLQDNIDMLLAANIRVGLAEKQGGEVVVVEQVKPSHDEAPKSSKGTPTKKAVEITAKLKVLRDGKQPAPAAAVES